MPGWARCLAVFNSGRMMHLIVSKRNIIGPDNGLLPGRQPMLDYCEIVPLEQTSVNCKRNAYIFMQENACQSVVFEMASILSWCVNML